MWRRAVAWAVLASGACAPSAVDDPSAEDERLGAISLRSGEIDTTAATPAAGVRQLIKFPGPITTDQARDLDGAAERIYTYLPYDTFLVKARPGARVRDASFVGDWLPGYKLAPSVAAARDAGDVRTVMILVFPDADVARVADAVTALAPGAVVGASPGARFSRIRLRTSELARHREALARLDDVFWIDVEPRRVLFNDTTVWVGQSGTEGSTPVFARGVYGQGQVVAVVDTGIEPDSCYFRDAARGLPPQNPCNGGIEADPLQRKVVAVDFLDAGDCAGGVSRFEWDDHGHGSHCAGTVAGDMGAALTHDTGDGMAPGAKLVVQDCGSDIDDCADCPGIGCPVVDLNPIFEQAYRQGARLHTNSWGDQENEAVQNNYTAASQDVDEFMWNHRDDLIFFAAGNSGPGAETVSSPSTAKNGVSVGATRRGTSADSLASFSSCGPTDDGRIKPDITVPGQSIVSAGIDGDITTNDCSRAPMSGTSMATPGATGLAALARQYFADGFYPTGAAVAADRMTPSGALVKAALINSARDMAGSDIPAACQGWGRVTLDDALYFPGDARRLWVVDDVAGFPRGSANASRTYRFQVAAGQALKATLAWTDFPSTPAASQHLVDDLDLVVNGPGGTYYGNVFSGGQSQPGGSADRVNTVEQVLLAAPAPGAYSVTVRAFTVPMGPQPFALLVTGAVEAIEDGPQVVWADDFETDKGWIVNPDATDTATGGRWERGNPSPTSNDGPKQLGTTVSGLNDLVTGRFAGSSSGSHDLDGGVTTILSPPISLPAGKELTMSFSYTFAHRDNSTDFDYFRVKVVAGGATKTVLSLRGAAADVDAAWTGVTGSLGDFAGQTVRIRIEAADRGKASLLEAAVDDVDIVARQP